MRTNCMDCLDRTNVVQGVFSRNIAHVQQHKLGLSSKPKDGNPFEKFTTNEMESAFRNAWTDNADALSILYTGTPALKTDFTRTGKRTQKGAIDDGKHAMIRYYYNNFTDGYNQDSLDFCQKKLKGEIKAKGFLTPLKMALITLIGILSAAWLYIPTLFPLPEQRL